MARAKKGARCFGEGDELMERYHDTARAGVQRARRAAGLR
jgi:hypothetical protein